MWQQGSTIFPILEFHRSSNRKILKMCSYYLQSDSASSLCGHLIVSLYLYQVKKKTKFNVVFCGVCSLESCHLYLDFRFSVHRYQEYQDSGNALGSIKNIPLNISFLRQTFTLGNLATTMAQDSNNQSSLFEEREIWSSCWLSFYKTMDKLIEALNLTLSFVPNPLLSLFFSSSSGSFFINSSVAVLFMIFVLLIVNQIASDLLKQRFKLYPASRWLSHLK